MSSEPQEKIIIGRFGKTFGVQGWLHIISFSEPSNNICQYATWWIQRQDTWTTVNITEIRQHQNSFIAKIDAIDNPEDARQFTNHDIAITASQLPSLPKGEHYRHNLVGMTVRCTDGQVLGKLTEIMETGANDVFIVENGKRRELIPYIDNVVICIDKQHNEITVEWTPLSDETRDSL